MIAKIDATAARRLFLQAQGLLDPPARCRGPSSVRSLVERLGFVQLDSINVVARAHELTLASRLDGYRSAHLASLLSTDHALFEHWTHDASAIPSRWYAHWKPRFRRDALRLRTHAWWSYHLGKQGERTVEEVRKRIAAEGPLRSADFEHPGKRGGWWGWKPQKAALDYLWRTGELAVRGRVNFHKVYDLAERVLPEHVNLPEPGERAHLEWACATAGERLVVFTPRELAGFWNAVDATQAKSWCAAAVKEGRLVPVLVEAADRSKPQPAYALADWRTRLEALPDPPAYTRLLSPFDPILRDRGRALRRFAFDYRFEAFTVQSKRRYGYYVLPILEGEQLVGRLDPKLHREESVLEIRGLWWEPGVKATRERSRLLHEAVDRLAGFLQAREVRWPLRQRRTPMPSHGPK